jgi:hypothetical protein
MTKHFFALVFFLFVPLSLVSAQDLPPEPDKNNTYFLTNNDGWGRVPADWKKQQRLLKKATNSDLETMALHSDTPAIRAMAFHTLASKHSPNCYEILLAELTDTDVFWVASYDMWFKECVSSFDMEVAESDSLLFSAEQWHSIDSVVVFGDGLQHLDKLPSASRLRGMDGLSDRLRNLYHDGDSNLLSLIVEGQNNADIPLVISALREYKMGLDANGADSDGPQGRTNYALNALMKWQNEAFVPILEELRDYELSRKRIDYYRVRMLFKVVMAYDDEWAYHFIEDTFDRMGGKDKFSYPEELYKAYYEENGPTRFLPLIKKYGEKPFDWDWRF